MVKNLPANAGDTGLIPVSGRSPGEENGNPLHYSCLGNLMDGGAWWNTALCCVCQVASVVSDSFVTPGTVACQVPVSMGFPRQEYWSGLPFSSPRDLPNAGIKPMSPALADRFPTTQSPGKSLTGCWQCLRSEFEVSG